MPARLLAATGRNDRVAAVVFSEESAHLTRVCTHAHRELGVQIHELGFLEATRRDVPVRECLRADRGADSHSGTELFDRALDAVAALCAAQQPSEVVVPLLRVHLDHAITRQIGEQVVASSGGGGARVSYYEDQPYACTYARAKARAAEGLVQVRGEAGHGSRSAVRSLLDPLRGLVSDLQIDRVLALYAPGKTPPEPRWRPLSSRDPPSP